MTLAPGSTRHPLTPHARFTVEQFHRLCEAVPERRLELIDGEVLDVIARGTRHSAVVNGLLDLITEWLRGLPASPWQLRVASPLALDDRSEPEPDLALVRRRPDRYLQVHPTAADTLLVIEVADSSLRFDLEVKSRLYADAGIPNDWVVDVLQPRLIPVLQATPPDPRLDPLRAEVETLLAAIPPV